MALKSVILEPLIQGLVAAGYLFATLHPTERSERIRAELRECPQYSKEMIESVARERVVWMEKNIINWGPTYALQLEYLIQVAETQDLFWFEKV